MSHGSFRVLALFLLAAASAPVWAVTDIQFSADQLDSTLAKGNEHTTLVGNARVHTKNTEIHADRIELYGTDFRYAICTGHVDVVDSERNIHLTGDTFFYDRQTEIARMEGNAVMEDMKNEVVVKAGFIESRGQENVVLIQIGVRIFKKNVVARSEFAIYHRDTDKLELSGMPVAYYKGDEYRAGRISIDLKTDDISLEGQVSGQIVTTGNKSTPTTATDANPSTQSPASAKSPGAAP
ncbi:MAG TPA: LptA/OstA family protein [Spirochaetia bacterium]|nr:LptA/OstA family protein [Spirochaetia bacterium]